MAQQQGEAGAATPPAVEAAGIVVAGHAAEGAQHRYNTGVLDALDYGVATAPRGVNVSSGNLARRTLGPFAGRGGPPVVAVAHGNPATVYLGLAELANFQVLQGAGRGEGVPVAGLVQGNASVVFFGLAEFLRQNPLPGAGHGGHPVAAVALGLPGAVYVDLAEMANSNNQVSLGTGRGGGGAEIELTRLLHGADPMPAYDNSASAWQPLVPVAGRGEERLGLLTDGSGGNLAGLILLPAGGPDEGAFTALADGPGAVVVQGDPPARAAYVDIGRLERQVRPGAGRGEEPAVDVVQRHPVVVRAEGFLTALGDVYRNLGAAYENFRALAQEIRRVLHSFSTAVGRLRSLLDAVWIIMALSTAVRALVAGVGSPAFVLLVLIAGMVLVILHVRRA